MGLRVLPWVFMLPSSRGNAVEQKQICVYKVVNLITGDFYIGKTCRGVYGRMASHRNYAAHGQSRLARAMRKYGVDLFSVSILKTCASDLDALAEEKRLISVLKPTYNLTPGGEGGKLSAEQLEHYIMTHKSRRKSYFWLGKKRDKGGYSRDALRKPVLCVETNQQFQSQVFAARFFNIERKTLGCALKTGRRLTKGNGAGYSFKPAEVLL